MRAQLTDVKGTGTTSEGLSGLSVYADVDVVQDVRRGGIQFVLEYENRGLRDVEIFNPIDYIQYTVLDAAGFPVRTPPYAPRPLIDTADEVRAHLENQFFIVSIRDGAGEKSVPEQLREKTVTLASGGSYAITLRIQKILKEGSPATPISIPSGAYKIVLICSLLAPADPGEEGSRSRLLQSEAIPVELR